MKISSLFQFQPFQRLQIKIVPKQNVFKGITMSDEVLSKYYGRPKPTKKYDTYVPSSQTPMIDYGNYSDEIKNHKKTTTTGILPESYDCLKNSGFLYYQGKLVSQYELVEEAVKTKAINLDEQKNALAAFRAAEKALILDKASPKYKWSNTLYSEDGMYVIKVNEKGERVGMTSALIDGVHIKDVAARIASGELNKNIETIYLNYLNDVDPELYEAATNIGREVRGFTIMFDLYEEGSISEKQFQYTCTLLNYLFPLSDDSPYENIVQYFKDIKSTGNWEKLLEDYSPEGFRKVDEERQITYKAFGGII